MDNEINEYLNSVDVIKFTNIFFKTFKLRIFFLLSLEINRGTIYYDKNLPNQGDLNIKYYIIKKKKKMLLRVR